MAKSNQAFMYGNPNQAPNENPGFGAPPGAQQQTQATFTNGYKDNGPPPAPGQNPTYMQQGGFYQDVQPMSYNGGGNIATYGDRMGELYGGQKLYEMQQTGQTYQPTNLPTAYNGQGRDPGQVYNAAGAPQLAPYYDPYSDTNTATQAILSRVNPQLDRQQAAMETQLANQGITRGSEAWRNAMTDFGQQRNDAYTQAGLQGINLGMQQQGQTFGQSATAANLDLARQQQQFQQGLQAGTFDLAKQGQQYNQAANNVNLGLAQQGQQFNQNMANLNFGMNQQNQQFGQQLQWNQFAQGAQNQDFQQQLANKNFGLAAQGQGFNQGMARNQFGLQAQGQNFNQGQLNDQAAYQRWVDQTKFGQTAQQMENDWRLGNRQADNGAISAGAAATSATNAGNYQAGQLALAGNDQRFNQGITSHRQSISDDVLMRDRAMQEYDWMNGNARYQPVSFGYAGSPQQGASAPNYVNNAAQGYSDTNANRAGVMTGLTQVAPYLMNSAFNYGRGYVPGNVNTPGTVGGYSGYGPGGYADFAYG